MDIYHLRFEDKERADELTPDLSGRLTYHTQMRKIMYLAFRTCKALERNGKIPNSIYIPEEWLAFMGFPKTLLETACDIGEPDSVRVESGDLWTDRAVLRFKEVTDDDKQQFTNLELV